MAEKKICSLDVSMDEPMLKALKGLAEADGVSASELVRMLVSTMIDERAEYYARLHSIFGDELFKANPKRTGPHPDDQAG